LLTLSDFVQLQWFPLARKEARQVATSVGGWLLAVLLVLWGYRPTYTGWDGLGATITAGYVQTAGTVLLPLGALLLSYQSIVGEQSSGSAKMLFGLPLTRTDVLLGKIIGRTGGIAVPVTAAFALLGVIGLVDHGLFNPVVFLGTTIVTLAYVAVMVTIGVSVSAVVDRTVTAAGVVFGVIFLPMILLWSRLAQTLFTRLTGIPVNPYDPPASGLLFGLLRLSPSGAYHVLSNWVLGVGNSADGYDAVLTELQPQVSTNAFVVEATFTTGTVPVYLHEAFCLLVFAVWVVVPLAVARYRFTRGDVL
jgi:ABC-type transport system involved in multi-copper enzyme maturation permease subunit